MYIEKMLEAVTPDIYEKFKTAVEIGKWPDGNRLSAEQKEICLQAIIAYEAKYLAEDQRTGYVPPKENPCDTSEEQEKPLKWADD